MFDALSDRLGNIFRVLRRWVKRLTLNNDIGRSSSEDKGIGRVSHAETCLFWRSARYVLDGHPALKNVAICLPRADGTYYPLLSLTLTRAKRLICWPVLPERVCAPEDEDKLQLTDHVTLELQSKKSHSTEFDPFGSKRHPRKWKICPFKQNGVSFWFGFAVRLSAVESQVLEKHQWIRMPKRHADDRVAEITRFFEEIEFVNANFPAEDEQLCNSVIALVFLVEGKEVKLSQELLQPVSQLPNEYWESPNESNSMTFVSTGFTVGDVQLGLLLCFSQNKLREDGPILFTPRPA